MSPITGVVKNLELTHRSAGGLINVYLAGHNFAMPRKDGYEFILDVRRNGHRLPAAALTAFARSEDRTRALLSGYQAHVTKPVEAAELVATVVSLTSRSAV